MHLETPNRGPTAVVRVNFKTVFLYYITNRKQLSANEDVARRLLLDRVRMAATAGVDAIQIRERDLSARELTELGRRAVEIARQAKSSAKVLINSRSDIAIACGADGVHLRSDDISAADARAIFMHAGQHPVIGVSCHTPDDVELCEGNGADFAVFGPVFEKDREIKEEGLSSLEAVCTRRAAKPVMPVLALGGVSTENAPECLRAGAAGIAGIRLFQNGNVDEVISRLRKVAD
jgi:thiamine-phosphate pyrophosphorylase